MLISDCQMLKIPAAFDASLISKELDCEKGTISCAWDNQKGQFRNSLKVQESWVSLNFYEIPITPNQTFKISKGRHRIPFWCMDEGYTIKL